MKYILILVGMIGAVLNCCAQAPKNTKRITVSVDALAGDNYYSLGRTLLDKGYQIEGDKDFLTIKTADSDIKGTGVYVQYYFVCKDKEIEVSGRATVPSVDKLVYVDVQNKGLQGFPMKEAFEDMEALAVSLGRVMRYR
ncbi:MAG: hypothetical protein QM762_11085 [Chryseolinea sp.]